MTTKQKNQFNAMLIALKTIAKGYQTTSQIRKSSQGKYGLDYTEALEMAYENIQNDAAFATKGVKIID